MTYTFQMPIPLAYYHVITCLCLIVTLLISYAGGYSEKPGTAVAWFVNLLILFGYLGMREVRAL